MKRVASHILTLLAPWTLTAAVVLTPDGAGEFGVTASNLEFFQWATDHGATTTGSFGRTATGFGIQNSALSSNVTAWLEVNFQSATGREFDIASFQLSSAVWNYGAGSTSVPRVSVFVVTDGLATRLFQWDSAELLPAGTAQRYAYSGGVPAPDYFGQFSSVIDISEFVVGRTEFALRFVSTTGWSSELGYGGAFYQEGSAPFVLTGAMLPVPEPSALVLIFGAAAGLGWRRTRPGR